GITHSERFERARREGGHMDGIQAWVALPVEDEECDPAFDHIGREGLPRLDEGGVEGRLVAGEAWGTRAAVPVRSPLFYIHWELAPGSRVALPPGYPERAVYIASGEVEIGHQRLDGGRMAVLGPGDSPTITARAPSVLVAVGGDPVGPRFIDWNFVSSRQERIEQAKADWQAGRMKLPVRDSEEFIPLPPERPPAPNPLSYRRRQCASTRRPSAGGEEPVDDAPLAVDLQQRQRVEVGGAGEVAADARDRRVADDVDRQDLEALGLAPGGGRGLHARDQVAELRRRAVHQGALAQAQHAGMRMEYLERLFAAGFVHALEIGAGESLDGVEVGHGLLLFGCSGARPGAGPRIARFGCRRPGMPAVLRRLPAPAARSPRAPARPLRA